MPNQKCQLELVTKVDPKIKTFLGQKSLNSQFKKNLLGSIPHFYCLNRNYMYRYKSQYDRYKTPLKISSHLISLFKNTRFVHE
jgi:hypothetical protein